MATTSSSTSTTVAVAEPVFTSQERLALAGFLAGYTGLTREAYALDLRQYAAWCHQRHLRLFEARRADIESFARDLEARGRARATITRRLCTIAGLYRYAVEEDLLDHSPAAHVRRPGWTTSRTPPGWTATSSARCWSPPVLGQHKSMRGSRCWP
jgi:integrase/recombinase XerD